MELEETLKAIYVYVKRNYEGEDKGKAFGIIMDFIIALEMGVIEDIVKDLKGEGEKETDEKSN